MRHFVLLSQQRSGSHMLINLLNGHPLVRCNGDLMWKKN
jgi:LPS sulfotransferase NodH